MYEYEHIAAELRRKTAEYLKAGRDRLPTQEALCLEYHVSRVTVRRALQQLEKEGCIRSRQGGGSMLTGISPDAEENRICFLIPDTSSYLMPSLCSDVRNAAVNLGYSLSLYETGRDFQKERDILNGFLEQPEPPRGLIAIAADSFLFPNSDLYRALWRRGCHIVFLDGKDPSLHAAGCVMADVARGTRDAVLRLISAGHREIAGVFNISQSAGRECASAWLDTLRDSGLSLSKERLLLLGDADAEEIITKGTSSLLGDFLKKTASVCSAILFETDLAAYSAEKILSSHGILVPQDLCLIAVFSSYLRTRSSVHIDSYEPAENPGDTAVRLLANMMAGNRSNSTTSTKLRPTSPAAEKNGTPHPETIMIPLRYVPGNTMRHLV